MTLNHLYKAAALIGGVATFLYVYELRGACNVSNDYDPCSTTALTIRTDESFSALNPDQQEKIFAVYNSITQELYPKCNLPQESVRQSYDVLGQVALSTSDEYQFVTDEISFGRKIAEIYGVDSTPYAYEAVTVLLRDTEVNIENPIPGTTAETIQNSISFGKELAHSNNFQKEYDAFVALEARVR